MCLSKNGGKELTDIETGKKDESSVSYICQHDGDEQSCKARAHRPENRRQYTVSTISVYYRMTYHPNIAKAYPWARTSCGQISVAYKKQGTMINYDVLENGLHTY